MMGSCLASWRRFLGVGASLGVLLGCKGETKGTPLEKG